MTTDSTFPWSSNRVNRGGSWNNNATNCRVANRNNNTPSNRNNNLGFRLAPQLSRECRKQFNGRTGNVGLIGNVVSQRMRWNVLPPKRMVSSSQP